MIQNSYEYNYIHSMIDDIENSYPIPKNIEEAIEYLYFLDRTFYDNLYSIDLIDYEKLIYIEIQFGENKKVLQLISNIKNNISNNFIIKHKYISRITDDLIEKTLKERYPDPPCHRDMKDILIRGGDDFYESKI